MVKHSISIFVVTFLASVTMSLYSAQSEQRWTIIPGVRVGEIDVQTKETDLFRLYGKENVTSAEIQLGEGQTVPGTVLFASQPDRKLEIIWKNSSEGSGPQSVILRGEWSVWRAANRISLGTSLKELETVNRMPFRLTGFGWDYGGTIVDFGKGVLCKIGYCDEVREGNIKRRKMILRLSPKPVSTGLASGREYDSVSGDREFSSGHPAMQKLNPRVHEMVVQLGE